MTCCNEHDGNQRPKSQLWLSISEISAQKIFKCDISHLVSSLKSKNVLMTFCTMIELPT